MFRLLLKVHEVRIRLREELDVQVVIKKGQENFIIPHKGKLKNGIAVMNSHAQFFICVGDPIFDIFVMILHGSGKKFAGMCEVNLMDWQENSNNATTSLLQKSPDSQATIQFDFMYLTSDVKSAAKNLISKGQLQSQQKSIFVKAVQQKNMYLSNQNQRLTQQVYALKKQNKELTQNQQSMKKQYNKNSMNFQNIIREKQAQIQSSAYNLNSMKEKINKIEEIVNNYGEEDLKQKMDNLLHQFSLKN